MGELTERLIRELKVGTHAALDDLWMAGDLIRRTFQSNYKSGFEEIDREVVSTEEAEDLKNALIAHLRLHPSAGIRVSIVHALSRYPDPNLRQEYVSELHAALSNLRTDAAQIFTCLAALEDAGEEGALHSAGKSSYGIDDVEYNIKKASEYLKLHGIIVPL
jgi:hypothetical protein